MPFQALSSLSLAKNEIAACEMGGHEKLQILDVSSNKLASLTGLGALPALRTLNASDNELADLNGINEAAALEELQLSQNKLPVLEGPWTERTMGGTLEQGVQGVSRRSLQQLGISATAKNGFKHICR
ncbi:unnamed protein product [Durusdinium trenchii]|uniref:Uncharacterized protein n=1 Tax=Durusdinium trenchii TaxID=1381693 RepID=A0ABP0MRW7_9DINO